MVKSPARFASIMPRWPGDPTRELTNFGGLSRSELMARVRGRGNGTTELVVLSLLRRERIKGWRRHFAVTGRPDFAWPRLKLAVFVDGCFWHAHDCRRGAPPQTNTIAWQEKIAANRRRDGRADRLLRSRGWRVLHLWECKLRSNPERSVRRIERAVNH